MEAGLKLGGQKKNQVALEKYTHTHIYIPTPSK
jgi:hypothetical protein